MRMSVSRLLAAMERDLAESGGTWYGGYDALVEWLNEAFDYCWNLAKERDPDGRLCGASAVATYTAGSETMPLTTWQDPAPSDIGEVAEVSGSSDMTTPTPLEHIDYRRRHWWEQRYQTKAWYMLGDSIGLVPVPNEDVSIELTYYRSGYRLYKPGTVSPAPPGGGTWADHEPDWFDGHYHLIAAYAVILAEMSEGVPSNDHKDRHATLESAFVRFLTRRRQRQQRDRTQISNLNAFRCYGS